MTPINGKPGDRTGIRRSPGGAAGDVGRGKTPTSLHKNVKLRLGVGFIRRFLDIMLAPLMVIHFSQLYGAAAAGMMTLVIAVAVIACTLVGGHLADVRGRRPTLLIGEAGSSAAFVLLALANSPWLHSGVATYAFYLLSAALFGIAIPANDSMMVDVSTEANRTQIYTINYWSINLAFVCGSLVGTFAYGRYFSYLLIGAAVLSAAIAIVTWAAVTETALPGARAGLGRITELFGYRSTLRDGVLARLILGAFFVRSVEIQISYYVAVRLARQFRSQRLLDIGSWDFTVNGLKMLGILRATNTLLVVALALFTARLFNRLTDQQRVVGGLVLFTAGYMVLAASNDPWLLIAAVVVLTAGELMSAPIRQVLLAALVPEDLRSRYLAVFQTNVRLGMVTGSLCVTLGVFIPAVGMSLIFALLGGAAILLYVSLFRVRDARPRQTRAVVSQEGTKPS